MADKPGFIAYSFNMVKMNPNASQTLLYGKVCSDCREGKSLILNSNLQIIQIYCGFCRINIAQDFPCPGTSGKCPWGRNRFVHGTGLISKVCKNCHQRAPKPKKEFMFEKVEWPELEK